jgi:hypothetical protein
MKTIRTIVMIITFFLLSGCYPGISGKVVDGVNGNPIEGAVVLAQWTTTGGLPGLSHHSVYKIEETETDKDGKFTLSGVYNPSVDPPEMVIYKKGYVPWRNDMTFEKMVIDPDEIQWKDNAIYKLEPWKEEYSKVRLDDFLDTGLIGLDYTKTPKFSKLLSEISKDAQPERELKWKQSK